MDLAISRLEHISAGDIGNVHAINAYTKGAASPPPGFCSTNLKWLTPVPAWYDSSYWYFLEKII